MNNAINRKIKLETIPIFIKLVFFCNFWIFHDENFLFVNTFIAEFHKKTIPLFFPFMKIFGVLQIFLDSKVLFFY